jgi:tripartite-type tricarboxylate transporter receptor subunit TctC
MTIRAALFLAVFVALQASAQTFPAKPIQLLTGYPPGGSAGFLSRVAADELSKEFGVPVVVENKPGAGGNIAAEMVARAAPSASPEAFDAKIAAEAPYWHKLVRDSGATVE